jgi:hypothetical protein
MAKMQIENSVSRSKYQWSGEALEKELEEANKGKKEEYTYRVN